MSASTKAPKQSITVPGVIRADEVYALDEFSARSRLGKWARRVLSARGGLKSTRVGNRRFILGADFIEYLKKQASDEELPCTVEPILHSDPAFVELLVKYNNGAREKKLHEKLRENLVKVNPLDAYDALIEYREEKAATDVVCIELGEEKKRSRITAAKQPMIDRILEVFVELHRYKPLSDRKIHYELVEKPVLKHASKPDSLYINDDESYDALTELLTRMRIDGIIPFDWIGDETRPVILWQCWKDAGGFVNEQINDLFRGYRRDLMQSQPNHIEILCEKNAIGPMLRPVASHYRIPMTTGRGYSSLRPRWDMLQRYKRSGKEKLVILCVSDADPEGYDLARSFARSMRDDLDIPESRLVPVQVALTREQIAKYKLPPANIAKAGSSRRKKFVEKYSEHVWELEALKANQLEHELQLKIDEIIDAKAFNAELESEKTEAPFMQAARDTAYEAMRGTKWIPDTDTASGAQ